mmetsp:Transcript_124586/g.265721  ORF Transcript_124586/g.265721 Transcript_124586/m.265721 type:complete len:303 (-) Transcript_124586:95-1003(-)
MATAKTPEKVAIVTGSSSGIGKETTRELVKKGFHVVLACRNKDKTDAVIAQIALLDRLEAKDCMTFLQLDTSSMASVKAFAAAFLKQFDRLDVLVHNAGTGYVLKENRTTGDGLEAFFQTNYLGPFMLSSLLLDILKKSGGRVVCVTSIEHWDGSYDFERVVKKTTALSYSTSKLMMLLHAFELRRRHGIPAAAVNPGGVKSGIWWYLRGWKKSIFEALAGLVLLSENQGCQTTVEAATCEALGEGAVYLTPYKQWGLCPHRSDYINLYHGPNLAMADDRAYNQVHWKELWDWSETKLAPFL